MFDLIGRACAQTIRILPSSNPESWSLDDITGANGLLSNVTTLALLLAGGIAVIFLIIGGINYLTAYGDEEKASTGKKTITWAIVGLIVILLAQVIQGEIWRFFSA